MGQQALKPQHKYNNKQKVHQEQSDLIDRDLQHHHQIMTQVQKEMFVSAFHTMFSEEIGAASASSGILSSRKSAKILSGVNQYSLCTYA